MDRKCKHMFVLDKELMEANRRTIKSKFKPISRGELECLHFARNNR